VKKAKKRILGVFRLTLEPDLKKGEIAFIKFGFGSAMMRHVIRVCKDKKLESIYGIVLKSNVKGVRFMKNMGFTIHPLDEETVKVTLDLKETKKMRKNAENLLIST